MEIMSIKGGGVRRKMENSILNFPFVFRSPFPIYKYIYNVQKLSEFPFIFFLSGYTRLRGPGQICPSWVK